MKNKKKIIKHKKSDGRRYCLTLEVVVSPSKRAQSVSLFINGFISSMTLGVVLTIKSFIHYLVMIPVNIEPLFMPPVS